MLDRLRIFNAEQKFLIGVRLLTGAIDPARAGKAFSDLADLTIGAALDAVLAEFAARHGRVRGDRRWRSSAWASSAAASSPPAPTST